MNKRTWISEHGESYAVPNCITEALHDLSWHNDMCPCFVRKDDKGEEPSICLWVDHPDMDKRVEGNNARYLVCRYDGGEVLLQTDDANAALHCILNHENSK